MAYGRSRISDLKILTKEAVVFILALSRRLGIAQRTMDDEQGTRD
jgi:hypothetical protein